MSQVTGCMIWNKNLNISLLLLQDFMINQRRAESGADSWLRLGWIVILWTSPQSAKRSCSEYSRCTWMGKLDAHLKSKGYNELMDLCLRGQSSWSCSFPSKLLWPRRGVETVILHRPFAILCLQSKCSCDYLAFRILLLLGGRNCWLSSPTITSGFTATKFKIYIQREILCST